MTGLKLFLKGRRLVVLVPALGALALAGRVLGDRSLLLGEAKPIPVPWAAVLPALAAYLVASASASPMVVAERLGARRVAMLTLVLVAVTTGLAAGAIVWATQALEGPLGAPGAVRNLAGTLGLALLGVDRFGVAAGWLLPMTAVLLAVVTASADSAFIIVDWLVRPDKSVAALIVAAALLLIGSARAIQRPIRSEE